MNVNRITQRVIGAAIEVHRVLGPSLLEEAYQRVLERIAVAADTICVSKAARNNL